MRSTDAMAGTYNIHNDFSKYPTDKPNISLSPGPTYFEKGKNITLPKCHVTSFPPAVITWSRVRGELAYSRTVVKDGQLSIISAQKRDSGLYECKASNDLGDDSALTLLSVLELPRFTSNSPAQLNVGRSQVSPEGTLQIRNIKDEDSGIYICIAISAQLFKRSLMQLTVGKEWFASVTFHWAVIYFSPH